MQIKARTIKGIRRFRRAGHRFDFNLRTYEVSPEELVILKAESMIEIVKDSKAKALAALEAPKAEDESKEDEGDDEPKDVDEDLPAAASRAVRRRGNK